MKTIKIFVASSEELRLERLELSDIVANLNYILNKLDINIILVKWEYMDASMGTAHKQEEYNDNLKDCEICLVLYWTKFGLYTKTELDVAYNELKAGHNPHKLYVYFKDSNEKEISDELKEFRDSFPTDYGHFQCVFSNVDALKTHFLLQFLEYQSGVLKNSKIVDFQDSKIMLGGKPYANLMNVSFAGNNEEYSQLLKSIKKTRKILAVLEVDDAEYSEYANELQDLLKRQQKMEESLWETALLITKLSATASSERLQRAIDLFNNGDNKGANAVLNEEEIAHDVQHNLHLMELGEQGRKGLQSNLEEYQLKIKTVKNEMAEGWGEKVLAIHEQLIKLAEKLYESDSVEYSEILLSASMDYNNLGDFYIASTLVSKGLNIILGKFGENNLKVADFYNAIGGINYSMGNYNEALNNYNKALKLWIKNFDEHQQNVAIAYNNIGSIYYTKEDYINALKYSKKSADIRISIFGNHHPSVAVSYNNIGKLYHLMDNNEKALEYTEQALKIWVDFYGQRHPDVALAYINLGDINEALGNYKKALEYAEKALDTLLSIYGTKHPDVALAFNTLGYIYHSLENYHEARNNYEKALKIDLNFFEENNPKLATYYWNLGHLSYVQGDYINSLEYFEKYLRFELKSTDKNITQQCEIDDNIYSIYLELINIDEKFKFKFHKFMENKVLIGTIDEGDCPAAKIGLKGEYIIFQFGDWNFDDDKDIFETKSKSKDVVLFKDSKIFQHHFDGKIGITLSLKVIDIKDKNTISEIYKNWKKQM